MNFCREPNQDSNISAVHLQSECLCGVPGTGLHCLYRGLKQPKSMNKLLLPLVAVGLLALAQRSFAATEQFTVSLDGAQDGGGGRQGSGSGTLTFDMSLNALTF